MAVWVFGAPAGTRTPDTLLKRQVLYLLSYWGRSLDLPRLPQIETRQSGFDLERKRERCGLPLTPWLGWRDSNPLYRSQSPVCYHYTTSQWSYTKPRPARPASARFQWGGIWGSNPRHPEPQSGALPTELIPPNLSAWFPMRPIMNSKQGFEVVFQPRSPFGEAISKTHSPHQENQSPAKRVSSDVARQEGFEPPTYCLEGSCSILLSYWRI